MWTSKIRTDLLLAWTPLKFLMFTYHLLLIGTSTLSEPVYYHTQYIVTTSILSHPVHCHYQYIVTPSTLS